MFPNIIPKFVEAVNEVCEQMMSVVRLYEDTALETCKTEHTQVPTMSVARSYPSEV